MDLSKGLNFSVPRSFKIRQGSFPSPAPQSQKNSQFLLKDVWWPAWQVSTQFEQQPTPFSSGQQVLQKYMSCFRYSFPVAIYEHAIGF